MMYKIIEIWYNFHNVKENSSFCRTYVYEGRYDKISAYKRCAEFYLDQLSDFNEYYEVIEYLKVSLLKYNDDRDYIDWQRADELQNEDIYEKIYDYVRNRWRNKKGPDFYRIRQIEMIPI